MLPPPPRSTLFPYTTLFRSCGLTRALHALVHGDVLGAFAMNPLGVLMLPLMALMVAWSQGWQPRVLQPVMTVADRKSTRLNSSHMSISYAVFCLKKKRKKLR